MKILPASIEDASIITQIKTAAYNDEKKRFGPWKNVGEGPKWYIDEWYNDIDETEHLIIKFHYYKLVEGDEIIGCFWLHDIDNATMELEDLCIHPSHKGKGYGYMALLHMESMYPEKKTWKLGTPFYSVRNHHLYQKAGYVKTGETAENMVFLYEKQKI